MVTRSRRQNTHTTVETTALRHSLSLSRSSLSHTRSLFLSQSIVPRGLGTEGGGDKRAALRRRQPSFGIFTPKNDDFDFEPKGGKIVFYLFYTVCHMFKNPDNGDGVELRIRHHTSDFGFSPKEGQYLLTRLNLITKLDIYTYSDTKCRGLWLSPKFRPPLPV